MPQSNAAVRSNEENPGQNRRPTFSGKHDGVEVTVWPNPTENGTMYNTTIKNSYKDKQSGEWKATESFSPTDLLVLKELAGKAFNAILDERAKGRGGRS